jgi:hypothetical protein
MPTLTSDTRLLTFLHANADSLPQARCEVAVATRLSGDHRGFRRMIRVIGDLAYKGKIKRENVDGWACVLSLPASAPAT